MKMKIGGQSFILKCATSIVIRLHSHEWRNIQLENSSIVKSAWYPKPQSTEIYKHVQNSQVYLFWQYCKTVSQNIVCVFTIFAMCSVSWMRTNEVAECTPKKLLTHFLDPENDCFLQNSSCAHIETICNPDNSLSTTQNSKPQNYPSTRFSTS